MLKVAGNTSSGEEVRNPENSQCRQRYTIDRQLFEHILGEKGKRGTYCQAKRIGIKSLDQTVINNLLAHILTMDNLRSLAENIAQSLSERSRDAGTRIMVIQDQLSDMQRSLENILDAIEKMGYTTHLQQRYDVLANVKKRNYALNWPC
jgi:hypothetical protein